MNGKGRDARTVRGVEAMVRHMGLIVGTVLPVALAVGARRPGMVVLLLAALAGILAAVRAVIPSGRSLVGLRHLHAAPRRSRQTETSR